MGSKLEHLDVLPSIGHHVASGIVEDKLTSKFEFEVSEMWEHEEWRESVLVERNRITQRPAVRWEVE